MQFLTFYYNMHFNSLHLWNMKQTVLSTLLKTVFYLKFTYMKLTLEGVWNLTLINFRKKCNALHPSPLISPESLNMCVTDAPVLTFFGYLTFFIYSIIPVLGKFVITFVNCMDNLRVSFYFISLMKCLGKQTCILLKKILWGWGSKNLNMVKKTIQIKKKNWA